MVASIFARSGKAVQAQINEVTAEVDFDSGNPNLPITGVDSIGGRSTSARSKCKSFNAEFVRET